MLQSFLPRFISAGVHVLTFPVISLFSKILRKKGSPPVQTPILQRQKFGLGCLTDGHLFYIRYLHRLRLSSCPKPMRERSLWMLFLALAAARERKTVTHVWKRLTLECLFLSPSAGQAGKPVIAGSILCCLLCVYDASKFHLIDGLRQLSPPPLPPRCSYLSSVKNRRVKSPFFDFVFIDFGSWFHFES